MFRHSPRSVAFIRVVAVACGASGALASAARAQPTIVNLGVLPGNTESFARAVSADGSVVVGETDGGFGLRGFRWSAGSMQSVGLFPGGDDSHAFGVSGDGSTVVGSAKLSTGWHRAFRRTGTGPLQNLTPVMSEFDSSFAFDASFDGSVVVGEYPAPGAPPTAFRWTSAGIQNLGVLPGGWTSSACCVSDDGSVVVGISNPGGGTFRWTNAGGMQDLFGTIPGWTGGEPRDVSADGSVVVGWAATTAGDRAFRWTSAGGMQNLGTIAGTNQSAALAVSGNGSAIVGLVNDTTSPAPTSAFLWTASRGMVDLHAYLPALGVNLTGWSLEYATDVNADGTAIVGTGRFNGQHRAWLVTGLPAVCYPNCDGSTIAPILNVNDFICFLNRFASGNSYANCDHSTTAPVLNIQDFTCFLNAFATGCT